MESNGRAVSLCKLLVSSQCVLVMRYVDEINGGPVLKGHAYVMPFIYHVVCHLGQKPHDRFHR